MSQKIMQGKRGLIMGVANKNSIAWGIAQACADAGAELAFTYQGEMLLKRVAPLAESVGADFVEPCDVTDEASMDALFEKLEAKWGKLDFVVHAIAFAGKEELMGRYVDTSAAAFDKALNISCYSFTAVAQRAEKLMEEGGAMITLSITARPKSFRITMSWALPKRRLRLPCAIWPAIWGRKAFASIPSRPGPFAHWRQPELAISAKC